MAVSHWLVKSEPNTYSFADLERDGRTVWDGVRNNAAALHLKAMHEGAISVTPLHLDMTHHATMAALRTALAPLAEPR